jgi:hypothetical protein
MRGHIVSRTKALGKSFLSSWEFHVLSRSKTTLAASRPGRVTRALKAQKVFAKSREIRANWRKKRPGLRAWAFLRWVFIKSRLYVAQK